MHVLSWKAWSAYLGEEIPYVKRTEKDSLGMWFVQIRNVDITGAPMEQVLHWQEQVTTSAAQKSNKQLQT